MSSFRRLRKAEKAVISGALSGPFPPAKYRPPGCNPRAYQAAGPPYRHFLRQIILPLYRIGAARKMKEEQICSVPLFILFNFSLFSASAPYV